MYWRFCLKSRFVVKIATADQQLWGKLNQRVVGKADRAQPCTRSHFILGSNLLSINRNKLTYFHCLLSTSSATIKLCGFPPPLINRTKNFPLHFQLVSLLPPKVLLEDWWLMMAMLKKKGICSGWQELAGFRRGQKWPWNLSSSAYLQFSRQMRRFCA